MFGNTYIKILPGGWNTLHEQCYQKLKVKCFGLIWVTFKSCRNVGKGAVKFLKLINSTNSYFGQVDWIGLWQFWPFITCVNLIIPLD